MIVRALVALALVAACGPREARVTTASPPPRVVTDAPLAAPPAPPPSLRLPDGVRPRAYDLRLEVDPDRITFRGHVEIQTEVDQPTDVIWLHAAGLEITSASYREGARTGALTTEAVGALRSLRLGHAVRGAITLVLDYTGSLGNDQEELFRQQAGGRWYLYSQAEALFARAILPCFDEPRFKAMWKVTLVVPGDDVALGNAPTVHEQRLPDGRREVALAEIGPLPTYLFAIAVGPFELVDAGTVGRAKIPLRIAVTHGHASRAAFAAATTGALVTQIEDDLGLPLPWPKLDLVEVPRLFGAMEHVGLITFDAAALLGDADDPGFTRRFVRVASHELAHQWFGNSVTPAWWDDLWLAEAFASWIADKVSARAGGFDDPVLRLRLSREHAIAADAEPEAQPLRRTIRAEPDIELTFDAIAYDKGAAVLAMFEQFVGEPVLHEALRAYLTQHARGTATSADVVAALAAVTTPEVGRALTSYLETPGTPIVDLAVRCDAGTGPVLEARARAGAVVPVCIRYVVGGRAPTRVCALVDGDRRIPLQGCPAWITGNADGVGYYEAAWADPALPPVGALTPGERIVAGDDAAAAIRRGELSPGRALAALHALAAPGDPYAALGALAIARAIDPLVAPPQQEAWSRRLAGELTTQLSPAALFSPGTPAARAIREQTLDLVRGDQLPRPTVARARKIVARLVATSEPSSAFVIALAIVAPRDGSALFDRLLAVIHTTRDPALAETLLSSLGDFGPELAPRVVALALAPPTRGPSTSEALVGMLERSATRLAAWQAIRDRWPQIVATLPAPETRAIITALGGLCDAPSRTEVAHTIEPAIGDLAEGARTLGAALAQIDRCIAKRTKFGDLGAALAR